MFNSDAEREAYARNLLSRFAGDHEVSFAAHREAEKLNDASLINFFIQQRRAMKGQDVSYLYIVLSHLGEKAKDTQIIDFLLDESLREKRKHPRGYLLKALGRQTREYREDEVLALLIDSFQDKRWIVRWDACEAAEHYGHSAVVPHLLTALASVKDKYELSVILSALSRTADDSIIPSVLPFAYYNSDGVASMATHCIERISGSRGTPLLAIILEKSKYGKGAAIRALQEVGDERGVISAASRLKYLLTNPPKLNWYPCSDVGIAVDYLSRFPDVPAAISVLDLARKKWARIRDVDQSWIASNVEYFSNMEVNSSEE